MSDYSVESAPVVVDRTDPAPPAITPDRAPDGGGWYRDRVTLTFAGAGDPALIDGSPGSGVDPTSVPAPVTFSTAGAHTAAGMVRDRAGNASRGASATVQVDASAPQARITCPGPTRQGEPAGATWSASDTGSGLAGPATGSLPLDTTRAGTFTARYDAADIAGHVTPATCTYVVEGDPDPEPSPSPTAEPTTAPTVSPTAEPTTTATAAPSGTQGGTWDGSPGVTADGSPSGSSGVPPTLAPTEPLAVRATAPRVQRASRVARDGRVRIVLGCAAACSGRLSLRAEGRTLAARRYRAAAGRATVALWLARRDRRAIARRGRLAVRVLVAPDGGDPGARRMTLRAR